MSGFYNRGRKCLLRGTNWVFKSESYTFVLKSLICVISVIMLIFFLFTLYIPIIILALRSTVITITHQDLARLSEFIPSGIKCFMRSEGTEMRISVGKCKIIW